MPGRQGTKGSRVSDPPTGVKAPTNGCLPRYTAAPGVAQTVTPTNRKTSVTMTAIAPVSAPPVPLHPTLDIPPPLRQQLIRGYTGPLDLDGKMRFVDYLARATNIPPLYRDNPSNLLVLIEHAQALNIAPAIAWKNIHYNADGVPGMRAVLMHALVARAGHKIVPVHVDERLVRLHLHRTDGMPSGSAKWSVAEAVRARLDTRDRSPWGPYPEDMLWARAISRVTRRYAPDITEGMYEWAELDSIPTVDDDQDPTDLWTTRDLDGNLTVAPDVAELLHDLDMLTPPEIRQRWVQASEEGKLGSYGGTIGDIQHTVEEILWGAGMAATEREREREQIAATVPAESPEQAPPADGDPAAQPGAPEFTLRLPIDEQPAPTLLDQQAGTPGQLDCRCDVTAVLATGQHEKSCTR